MWDMTQEMVFALFMVEQNVTFCLWFAFLCNLLWKFTQSADETCLMFVRSFGALWWKLCFLWTETLLTFLAYWTFLKIEISNYQNLAPHQFAAELKRSFSHSLTHLSNQFINQSTQQCWPSFKNIFKNSFHDCETLWCNHPQQFSNHEMMQRTMCNNIELSKSYPTQIFKNWMKCMWMSNRHSFKVDMQSLLQLWINPLQPTRVRQQKHHKDMRLTAGWDEQAPKPPMSWLGTALSWLPHPQRECTINATGRDFH